MLGYPLARAMDDGFVKEPAVVTQRNFDARNMPPEEVERVKLQDGVRLHEATKVELKTYARNNATNGVKEVNPFMLVIARDTTHAGRPHAASLADARAAGRDCRVGEGRSGRSVVQACLRPRAENWHQAMEVPADPA